MLVGVGCGEDPRLREEARLWQAKGNIFDVAEQEKRGLLQI